MDRMLNYMKVIAFSFALMRTASFPFNFYDSFGCCHVKNEVITMKDVFTF